MKKTAVLIVFLLNLCLLQAQTLKYQRVLIPGGNELMHRLAGLGITIDHSHALKDGIETEISELEIKVLKDNNIPYKTLVPDLAAFYNARNSAGAAARTMAGNSCNDPKVQVPSHFHLGSMGGYFTLPEMENILDSMALLYPNIVKAKQPISIIQTIEGRKIWYVKFSDNPNVDENEPEVLYTALHHAREGASLSQLIFYMWHLLENYATDPDIQATLNNSELFFVPCVNPDGYVFNQTTDPNGGGMWRKNRRDNGDGTFGVDLNRNYGTNWGYDNVGSSPSSMSDTYRGTAAFSEPETQAVRDFCNTRQFKNALNAHTFSNVLIYPWSHIPNFYTPDNTTYSNWGNLLTRDSRFLHGTINQTLNYLGNGGSDDWMYGEQATKPKILAMTPEAGSYDDGFWPLSGRIVDICKTTFTQNYNLARLAGDYAVISDDHDKFISGNGFIKYKIQRLGLSAGSYTVSLTPIGNGIASVGAAKVYPLPAQNQLITDSVSYVLNTGLVPAQVIKYALSVNNGIITRHDTISKIYGSPITLFEDDGSSANTNFDETGIWGITTTDFVSPPSAITDSPGGDYSPDDHKTITTKGQVSLANALYAHLQYYTKFEIEKSFDYAQVQISTDNGVTYQPLCGRYETSPASFGGTFPVYDGKQNDWVKEDIDLSAYIGQNIKIRFRLDADFYTEKDGFYFDDVLIRKIGSTGVGINENIMAGDGLLISPNPSAGMFNIYNQNENDLELVVYNTLGQVVLSKNKNNLLNSEIDLRNCADGVYFIKLRSVNGEVTKKLLIEK